MSKIFGEYIKEYEDIVYFEKNNKNEIYSGNNIKENRQVSLKIISKEQVDDCKLQKEKLEMEKEIVNICKSDNILGFYRYMETDKNFIIEQENYEMNLYEYLKDNGPLSDDKKFFKMVAIEIAKALKILYEKKIIHRYIKTNNIFLQEKNDGHSIKLGEFNKAIYIKENTCEPIDRVLYTAPELINGEKYDEKCDLWSFGLVLYELYFGDLPYGHRPTKNRVIKAVNDEENFHLQKSNISTLDNILDGLLKINPNQRINFEQLFKLIFSDNFMEIKDKIEIKKKESLIDIIKEKENLSPYKSGSIKSKKPSSNIDGYELDNNSTKSIKQEKYNNILYYDENDIKGVYKDSDLFENVTNGAFILCTDKNFLKIIKEEILTENQKDNKIKFNIISTGSSFKTIIKLIIKDKKFKNCFNKICIYCMNIKKYELFGKTYKNFVGNNIYNKIDDIIQFINFNSSNEIKPFRLVKLISQKCHMNIYKDKYSKLTDFYSILKDDKINKKYFEEIRNYIN